MVWNENVLRLAERNTSFREVLVTGQHSQVVVMSIPPGGAIGNEVHPDVDQVIVVVEGEAEAVTGDLRSVLSAGHLLHVPAGTWHDVVNSGSGDLKLYTIYSPPQHAPGTVHPTRADAEAAEAAAPGHAQVPAATRT